jgi:hypothetical protein
MLCEVGAKSLYADLVYININPKKVRDLTLPQLAKKYPEFYVNRRYSAILTRSPCRYLSSVRLTQSIPLHEVSLKFVLILCFQLYLCVTRGLSPSDFPTINSVRIYLFFPHTYHMSSPYHSLLSNHHSSSLRGVQYKSQSS